MTSIILGPTVPSVEKPLFSDDGSFLQIIGTTFLRLAFVSYWMTSCNDMWKDGKGYCIPPCTSCFSDKEKTTSTTSES